MWIISTLQLGKMGLPPAASLPLSQNNFSHKNKKTDILRIEWVCVWKAEISENNNPSETCRHPPALCTTALRHVHRRRECSFASHAQPVPPVAPCNPSAPSSPLSISCVPAWGPNAGCPPSLSPPSPSSSPTATLPPPPSLLIPTQAEGLALPYIAASAAGWRWEEPSGLQTVSGLETPLWSTPTATWGGNNNTSVTKRSEWLMLSICEIWNKSALLSDPNRGCLCDRKTEGQKPRRRQPQLFTMHKSNSHALIFS